LVYLAGHRAVRALHKSRSIEFQKTNQIYIKQEISFLASFSVL
jgi:hypothetical protein